MKSDAAETQARIAREALYLLCQLAKEGDAVAIMHLHGMGETMAADLQFLAMCPASAAAVARSASLSDQWIVSIPAIKELRTEAIEKQLPPSLGTQLTIQPLPTPGSGGARTFEFNSRTGFAHQVWSLFDAAYGLNHFPSNHFADVWVRNFMNEAYLRGWQPNDFQGWVSKAQKRMAPVTSKAQKLPMLTDSTLSEWVDLGMEWADAVCLGRWEEFPWPQKILDRSEKPSSKFSMSPRGCKAVVSDWLKSGFASLIRAAGTSPI